jgi:hypothetical protein
MKVYEAISFIWGRWKAALLLVSRRLTQNYHADIVEINDLYVVCALFCVRSAEKPGTALRKLEIT